MPVFDVVLVIHSVLRWVVVLGGLWAVVRAVGGLRAGRTWNASDDRAGLIFTVGLDVQLLLGLLLYAVLSPITTGAFGDMGEAMRNGYVRFWVVEHLTVALVAIALAHVGRVRVRRAAPAAKHRQALVFFGLALAAALVAVPWPFLSYGRPWLPLG
jgi:hypothetical protein